MDQIVGSGMEWNMDEETKDGNTGMEMDSELMT